MDEEGTGHAVGYTFKQKLHAWWEGYDLPPFGDLGIAESDDDAASSDDGGTLDAQSDPNTLSPDKLAFLQLLWGDGFVRPGSKDQALNSAKPLLLTDSTTVIEFGSGLGVSTRAVAAANICYVDGFESDRILVDAASTLKQSAEEAKFASVRSIELGSMPNDKTYHRAIFNRYLHRLEDPVAMLGEMKMQLKEDGGAILLNEYTAGLGGLLPDATQAMMDGFGAPRALISRDVYATALEELGFEIRVNEDLSAEHMRDIAGAWTKLDERLVSEAEKIDLGAISGFISDETARWGAISKALREGSLEYARILAILK
ncbi:MAG: class I SAM-dependent methyltransferase [Pseudomonadota bacterium]